MHTTSDTCNFVPMMNRIITAVLFICIAASNAQAQLNVRDSAIAIPWVSVQYGFNLTAGDLVQRHGHFNHIGVFAGYKTRRNWVYGIDGSFMFGNDVKRTREEMFGHLMDEKGNITDQNGDAAIVVTASRGLHVNLNAGKILPIFNPNPNSGLYVSMGAGFLAHKIRVETQDHVVPTLELDYRKGYDRLVQGANISGFLGYAYMSSSSFVKFYGGFYYQHGFTYDMRTIFFDEPQVPVSQDLRNDIQFGLRVGWLIPIYPRQPKEFYFD